MQKKVAYCSQHIPPEWIAAHGLEPVRISPDMHFNSPIPEMEGLCDFMRAFFNHAHQSSVDAIVATTVCDQMRRGFDLFARNATLPTHLFNQPAMWKRTTHLKLYMYELDKLSLFLEELGGKRPGKNFLKATMLDYEEKRKKEKVKKATTVEYRENTFGIGLIGGPLTNHEAPLLEIIKEQGAQILFDSTEFSVENAPLQYDRRTITTSPFESLAQHWFEANHTIYQRPNTKFYQWLQQKIVQTSPRALIINRWIWCDFWHGETERIRNFSTIPVLVLDVNKNEAVARNRTRVEAFLESLQEEHALF